MPHERFSVSLEFNPDIRPPRLLEERRIEVREARNRAARHRSNAVHALDSLRCRLRVGRSSHIGRNVGDADRA